MKIVLMMTLALSASVALARGPIEDKVAFKLDYLFSDTINEGDFTATVTKTNCQVSATNMINVDLVSCQVMIDLKAAFTCLRSCELKYEMRDKDVESLEILEEPLNACLSQLNQGC